MDSGCNPVFEGVLDEGIYGNAFLGEAIVGNFMGQGLWGKVEGDIGIEGDAFRGPFEWGKGFSVGECDAE
jgi:hypothetical protein